MALRILQFAEDNAPLSSLLSVVKNEVLNMQDQRGWTALHHACHHGNKYNIEQLLSRGADPTMRNCDGETPLHLAGKKYRADLLVLFVGRGVDWNATDRLGQTVLHCVCNLVIVRLRNVRVLLENGADPSVRNRSGQSPLHLAAVSPQKHLMQLLVKSRCELNDRDKNGCTALLLASRCGEVANVRYILEGGARVDVQNKEGETALHEAAKLVEVDVLEALCEAVPTTEREVLDIKDSTGSTALHYAVQSGRLPNVLCLLEKSAYVDSTNKDGDTPLHIAASKGFFNCVEHFVNFGVSVDIKNKQGHSVFKYLIDNHRPQFFWNVELKAFKFYRAHSLKLKILGIPVDEEIENGLSGYRRLLVAKSTLQLQLEVQKIKNTKVDDEFYLIDIVTQGDHPKYLMEADLVQKLETLLFSPEFLDTFRYYGHILRTRYGRAKRSTYYLGLLALQSVYRGKRDKRCEANEDVWRMILSYLEEDDLVNFIKSE